MARFAALVSMMFTLTLGTSVALGQNLSHLGQPVDSLVTVKCTACIMNADPLNPFPALNEIVNPDASTSPFVVPNGKVFVITDVEWFLDSNAQVVPTGTAFLILNLAKKNTNNYVSVFASKATPVVGGRLAMHESLTAGIVVAPEVRILPEMITSDGKLGNATVFVHGYFVSGSKYSSVRFPVLHSPVLEKKK
jgi:hypothetical protein